MSIFMPRDLFPQIFEDQSVNPASRRKVVLPRITRQVLESKGYKFHSKIRVPGGYAFEITDPDGSHRKLGLKTAVNRWLNTAHHLVEMVDTVVIATFDWDEDDEKPLAFELVEIESSTLLKMIDKVRKAAKARSWDPDGHYYMPLDETSLEDDHVGCVAGAVIPAGKVLFGPEAVTWVNDEWGRVTTDQPLAQSPQTEDHSSRSFDMTTIIVEAKADLARKLGISADRVELTIRL